MPTHLSLFQDKQIRRHRDEVAEKRWFSVVDIIEIASWSSDGRKYRNKLKQRLKADGSEVVTNCHQLKMIWGVRKSRTTEYTHCEGVLSPSNKGF